MGDRSGSPARKTGGHEGITNRTGGETRSSRLSSSSTPPTPVILRRSNWNSDASGAHVAPEAPSSTDESERQYQPLIMPTAIRATGARFHMPEYHRNEETKTGVSRRSSLTNAQVSSSIDRTGIYAQLEEMNNQLHTEARRMSLSQLSNAQASAFLAQGDASSRNQLFGLDRAVSWPSIPTTVPRFAGMSNIYGAGSNPSGLFYDASRYVPSVDQIQSLSLALSRQHAHLRSPQFPNAGAIRSADIGLVSMQHQASQMAQIAPAYPELEVLGNSRSQTLQQNALQNQASPSDRYEMMRSIAIAEISNQNRAAHQRPVAAQSAAGSAQDPSAPRSLYLPQDEMVLSEFHCLARSYIEAFAATELEVDAGARGRNIPIVEGQVGIRCRFCSGRHIRDRSRGSAYYPSKLNGVYQTAINMVSIHILDSCRFVPPEKRALLLELRKKPTPRAGSGPKYWAKTMRMLGVEEAEDGNGLRFR